MGINRIENRLERLVEGVFNRTMRSGVQPVELGRRLTREMDLERQVGVRGLLSPNAFTFWLSEKDRNRLSSIEPALIRDLVLTARDHADNESYTFAGPVAVFIETGEKLRSGSFRLETEFDSNVQSTMGTARIVLDDGSAVAVGDEPVIIGRLPECDVTLSDANTSRHHAEVALGLEGYILTDLDSTNGTKVNGVLVKDHLLADGDVIEIGACRLRFEAD